MASPIYDVLIVGYGPTGMMAAILLGRAGHRVAVFERHKTLYNLPRVGIVHDDVLRMFQQIGCTERIRPSTFFLPSYELANHDRILLRNKVTPYATHGWPEFISIYQPAFEVELDRLAKALPSVEVHQGHTVTAVGQDSDAAEITVEDETGATRRVRGRYLIAADGGNSFVRGALDVALDDLGFNQNWLVDRCEDNARPRRPAALPPVLRAGAARDDPADGPPASALVVHDLSRRIARGGDQARKRLASPRPIRRGHPGRVRADPRGRVPVPLADRRALARWGGSSSRATPRTRCRPTSPRACAPDSATPTTSPGSWTWS